MKGELEPKILVVDHDGVHVWFKPQIDPKCSKPCKPEDGTMCNRCRWLAFKEGVKYGEEFTIATEPEAKAWRRHELN